MDPNPALSKNQRWVLALSLSLCLFTIHLLVYRGGFHSIDEVSMFAVTESMVKFGRVNTDQIAWTQWTTSQAEAQGFFGLDGHVYSKKGLALSLAQAPLYWLALHLPHLGMLQTVSLLNALITSATALLLFMFLDRLGFPLKTSVITSFIFGLATIAFVYAKYLFSEPLAGLLLLLSAYMLYTYRQEGGLTHLLIAGLAAGTAVLARANNLFLLPLFGLYLLWIALERAPVTATTRLPARLLALMRQPTFIYALLTFAGSSAIPGLILLSYNAARSGHPLQTGYDLALFSPNILLGLYKLLFSPLRGLFVYSPILLLSLPGWIWLRRRQPAEAWLFAGLVAVTVGLFSAWSSGEGLSWGSRFLVPLIPFLSLCLAPIIDRITGSEKIAAKRSDKEMGKRSLNHQRWAAMQHATRNTHYVLRIAFYPLLLLSLIIQILGVTINPWIFLGRLQADLGGEFFLENTDALYDFRYSQIVGQWQAWSPENSDLAWLSGGFDGPALGLSLALALLSGSFLWLRIKWACSISVRGEKKGGRTPSRPAALGRRRLLSGPADLVILGTVSLIVTYWLLGRYNQTDRQFGPPDDGYTQALTTIAARSSTLSPIITVAQNHYHVPMNRFKDRLPLIGFAQQRWPLPQTAIPLLEGITATHQEIWLVTVGFPPAAADNATEQWLARTTFKVQDLWLPDDVRLVHFTTRSPTTTRAVEATFDQSLRLLSADITTAAVAGQPLPVELSWQALSPLPASYALFLQLLDRQGALVAQQDSLPEGGYAPTSSWSTSRPIVSRQALLVPPDLAPGDYRLIAGWYDPASGQRLPAANGLDFVELGQVTVK